MRYLTENMSLCFVEHVELQKTYHRTNLVCCSAYISAYVIDLAVLGPDLIRREMYIRASR